MTLEPVGSPTHVGRVLPSQRQHLNHIDFEQDRTLRVGSTENMWFWGNMGLGSCENLVT